jgi:hypothetical protein
MKLKVHGEFQSRRVFGPGNGPMSSGQARTEEEIRKVFPALDSYASRAAKDPNVTFHQHLRSILLMAMLAG